MLYYLKNVYQVGHTRWEYRRETFTELRPFCPISATRYRYPHPLNNMLVVATCMSITLV
jgi:hypothetical protein